MIRVLHSVSNMDRAGIETMLMNYYRHIDKSKVQFDFLCNKTKPGAYDEEIKSLGGRIFYTPGLNPLKYAKYLSCMKNLFMDYPEYKIVEAHNGALGVYALHAAKRNNIPVRIFHAHGASITKDWKYPLKLFCRSQLKFNKNINFTCGNAAAECYFEQRIVDTGKYVFIPNAIEVERFIYSEDIRNEIRNKYNLQEKKIIGHVGRFMTQKNHSFLLKVFEQIHKQDSSTVLVLLGDGELMDSIKNLAKSLGIDKDTIFIGNVGNANEWYNAFDVFVLPSIWEGLPVVGIEAQANDLPCIFSDSVTREVSLSEKTEFIALDADVSVWVRNILKMLKYNERRDNTQLITAKHYNIHH